jgi:arylsulfatase A-like enzyme
MGLLLWRGPDPARALLAGRRWELRILAIGLAGAFAALSDPWEEARPRRLLQDAALGLGGLALLLAAVDACLPSPHEMRYAYTPVAPGALVRAERIGSGVLAFGGGSLAASSWLAGACALAARQGWRQLAACLHRTVTPIGVLTAGFVLGSGRLNDVVPMAPWGPPAALELATLLVSTTVLGLAVPWMLARRRQKQAAALLALGLALPALWLPAALAERAREAAESARPQRRVVLVTLDTTRADHLGAYGYARDTSPNLDRLAREGAVFDSAWCPVPQTEPSHSSILSGVRPDTHGLTQNGMRVTADGLDWLQAWFAERGFATAAVSSRARMMPGDLGWAPFQHVHGPVGKRTSRSNFTIDNAVKWLKVNKNRDFFLWVHLWDPHWPYRPIPGQRERYVGRWDGYLGKEKRWDAPPGGWTKERLDYGVALYDAEIRWMDANFGRLWQAVAGLAASGQEPPLFVVTADHGETLDERAESAGYVFSHLDLLSPGVLRVPLLFWWPGRIPAGTRVAGLSENADLAPTILDLLEPGASAVFRHEGASRAGELLGGAAAAAGANEPAPADRWFVAERGYNLEGGTKPFVTLPEDAVLTRDWMLIENPGRGTELFDLRADPVGLRNVAGDNSARVQELRALRDAWRRTHAPPQPWSGQISGRDLEILRALGYVQ